MISFWYYKDIKKKLLIFELFIKKITRFFVKPTLRYTAITLSTIGGIFLVAIRGMPFSISAGAGFIALFGVEVLNGIVLIAEFNRLTKNRESDVYKIALIGSKTILRSVLMTAIVASLGGYPRQSVKEKGPKSKNLLLQW